VRLGKNEMFTVRFAAEDVLVAFKATRELLILAADRTDRIARRHAIRALGRIGDESAIGQLMNLLGEEDWRIRYEAAGALARFDSSTARAALRAAAAKEAHPHVRGILDAT
jgi:HEAT repeat protein